MGLVPLTQFLERSGTSTIATLLVVSMVPTYLLMLVQAAFNRRLRTAAAPLGIASFQLAGTDARAQAIVDSWDDSARSSGAARTLAGLPLSRRPTRRRSLLGCIWASRQLAAASTQLERARRNTGLADGPGRSVRRTGKPGPTGPALPGARGGLVRASPLFAASAKFVLAAVGLSYWFAGVAAWVVIDPMVRLQIVLAVVAAGLLIQVYLGSLPRSSISRSGTSRWSWSSSWSTGWFTGRSARIMASCPSSGMITRDADQCEPGRDAAAGRPGDRRLLRRAGVSGGADRSAALGWHAADRRPEPRRT